MVGTRYYEPAIDHFVRFCRQAETKRIIDLCSGTGEASMMVISPALEQSDQNISCTLSDLSPRPSFFDASNTSPEQQIDYCSHAVDAMKIANLDYDTATFFASFHHFNAGQAQHILSEIVTSQKSVFIVEPVNQTFTSAIPLLKHSFLPGMFYVFKAKRWRLLKLLFVNILPVVPLLGWWDTIVSAKRSYSEEEYRLLTAQWSHYDWSYREVRGELGQTVTIFSGTEK